MKQNIQLQVPEPCHENWNAMTSTQQGRFCMSCRKEVIDFSVMTDKEILAHISTASKSICGRFCGDQLNRDLKAPAEPRKIWWRYWMGIAASLMLLAFKSSAQVKLTGDTIVAVPLLIKPEQVVLVAGGVSASSNDYHKKSYFVTGSVKDENNNPLAGATILIKGTKKGAVSDENGAFGIKINDTKNVILDVSYVGYEMQEIKVNNHTAQSSVNISVTLKSMMMGLMGDVVIARKKKNFLNYFKKDSIKNEALQVKQSLVIYPNPVMNGTDIKMNIDNLPEGNYRLSFMMCWAIR